jgi:hypothetical protein
MRKRFLVGLTVALATTFLYGCWGKAHDNDPPAPLFSTEIFSLQSADGDIAFTAPSSFSVSSAMTTGNVYAGVDPANGNEFRGFLDFPLDRPAGVPVEAIIQSAILEFRVNSVSLPSADATVPMIIDMVNLRRTLVAADYDREAQPPLLSLAPFIFFSSDAGNFVAIDVTPLMQEAQRLGLPNLQLRFLLDFDLNSGLIEITDDEDAATAPLLAVTFY